MADNELSDILDPFIADLQSSAKMEIGKAKAFAAQYAPDVVRWAQEANAAEAAGDADLAASKRASIEQVKDAAILDLATFGVEKTDATEKLVVAAIDRLIAAIK